MKKFTGFFVSVLFILAVSLSTYSQGNTTKSGDQLWAIDCGSIGSKCMENYPKFFKRIEDDLRQSSRLYESIGVKNGRFLEKAAFGTSAKTQTGPYLKVMMSSNPKDRKGVLKGAARCKNVTGEVASYALGKKWRGAILLYNFPFYNMFDSDDDKPKLIEPCPFEIESVKDLVASLSHEAFHGYQYHNTNITKGKNVATSWIDEATAEAAAYEYTKKQFGKGFIGSGRYYYDLPLHDDSPKDDNDGYERGHFMYEVGKMINPSSPLKWMLEIYDTEPVDSRFGYDWLDKAFKDAGQKNLSEGYIKFIAKKANSNYYYKTKPQNVNVISRDAEPVKISVISDIMAAQPFYADYKGNVFREIPDSYPGEYAALLEIKINPKDKSFKPVLVVENEVAKNDDRKKHVALAALNNKPKKLFSRAINAPTKDDSLKEIESDVEVSAKTIQFSLTNCMMPGKTKKISFEPEMPKEIEIKMFAKYGKIDKKFNYTAPNQEVTDELKIELLTGETKTEKLVFAKPRITRKGCQYRLKTADGYTVTFDPGTKTTKTEGRNARESAVFDREFVYVKDPSMGWLKMRPSQMQQMLRMAGKATIGFPSISEKFADIFLKGMINMQRDPLKWGKAPYDFLDWLELSELNKHLKSGRVKKEKAKQNCPSSGGKCTVYSIEGGSKVFYDSKNRIDAIKTKDGIHKVEYGAYVFEVPKKAQLIQF